MADALRQMKRRKDAGASAAELEQMECQLDAFLAEIDTVRRELEAA